MIAATITQVLVASSKFRKCPGEKPQDKVVKKN